MATLKDLLLGAATRPNLVRDCTELVEREVAGKSGFSGLAVKGAMAVVRAVRPDFVRHAVDGLLDEFVEKLEPFYAELTKTAGAQPLASYLVQRAPQVASTLLQVTDARVNKLDQPGVRKTYEKLRDTAQKHVEAAMPGIAGVLSKYVK